MIWEVDEDLDGKISWDEFILMYKRCIREDSQLEPKSLFHLVRFLMFIHSGESKNSQYLKMDVKMDEKAKTKKIKITEEDTLELIFVRTNKIDPKTAIQRMEAILETIFGQGTTNARIEGQEKEISFEEYLNSRKKLALDIRKSQKEKEKADKNTLKKREETK